MATRTAPCPKCITGTVALFVTCPTCKNCHTAWLSRRDFNAEVAKAGEKKTSYLAGELQTDLDALVSLTRLNTLELVANELDAEIRLKQDAYNLLMAGGGAGSNTLRIQFKTLKEMRAWVEDEMKGCKDG